VGIPFPVFSGEARWVRGLNKLEICFAIYAPSQPPPKSAWEENLLGLFTILNLTFEV